MEFKVEKRLCPICNRATIRANAISQTKDKDDAGLWYSCSCGVMFNANIPAYTDTEEDIKISKDIKEYPMPRIQAARVYAPIIEELTLSRKMLDVGFQAPETMDFMKQRGWVTFGIDNNPAIKGTNRIIADDFETYKDFCKEEFDLVWMSHVLERFKDPMKALIHARTILKENGVIYIATPDIDFLYSKLYQEWPHWDKKKNYIMFNETSLKRELERLGFKVIVNVRNYYSRFGHFCDLHIVAQKVYF